MLFRPVDFKLKQFRLGFIGCYEVLCLSIGGYGEADVHILLVRS